VFIESQKTINGNSGQANIRVALYFLVLMLLSLSLDAISFAIIH